jgi:hypothetical protein
VARSGQASRFVKRPAPPMRCCAPTLVARLPGAPQKRFPGICRLCLWSMWRRSARSTGSPAASSSRLPSLLVLLSSKLEDVFNVATSLAGLNSPFSGRYWKIFVCRRLRTPRLSLYRMRFKCFPSTPSQIRLSAGFMAIAHSLKIGVAPILERRICQDLQSPRQPFWAIIPLTKSSSSCGASTILKQLAWTLHQTHHSVYHLETRPAPETFWPKVHWPGTVGRQWTIWCFGVTESAHLMIACEHCSSWE